jgi:pimeloyl-ACP methyl ester carboxylesterase
MIEVLGHRMVYVEEGSGDPIVLRHGNPMSSFPWCPIIPHLAPVGRGVAPDLIGMGDSDELRDSAPSSHRFVEHRRYLDAFLDAVGATSAVTLVLHDWGSALGFDWAARHPESVAAIACMKATVGPVTWDDRPDAAGDIFQALRSSAGEEVILARRGAWLAASTHVRKLLVNAEPGSILTGRRRPLRRSWPNQTEINVPGIHFIQEGSGDRIGAGILLDPVRSSMEVFPLGPSCS